MSALVDRNSNITSTSNPTEKQAAGGEENKPQDGQPQHKSMFMNKSLGQNDKQYVSPSDNIISPASQKLSSFKQRQINKQGTKNPAARTLFARTPSGSSGGFDDMDTSEKKL